MMNYMGISCSIHVKYLLLILLLLITTSACLGTESWKPETNSDTVDQETVPRTFDTETTPTLTPKQLERLTVVAHTPVPSSTTEPASEVDDFTSTPSQISQDNDEEIPNEQRMVLDFALSPDGEIIAVYSNTGIFLYRLDSMEMTPFVVFDNHNYSRPKSGAVAFSHDGRLMATSGKFTNQEISIWSIDDGKVISTIANLPKDHFITEIEFSPDGSSIMIRNTFTEALQCQGYIEDQLTLFDVNSENLIFNLARCSIYPPIQFQFLENNNVFLYLGSMSAVHHVYFIDGNNGQIIHNEERDWNLDGNFYSTSPDGEIYVIQKYENEKFLTYLVDSLSNETLQVIEGKIELYIDDNKFVVNNYGGGSWDYRVDGVSTCLYGSIYLSPKVKMSTNGKLFAFTNEPAEVQIWNISSCEIVDTINIYNNN